MSRRALRKINPSLDLSPFLRSLDQLDRSWVPSDWFGEVAPLEIEIGSGKGLFMVTASAQRPEHQFLGIEISRKYARFAAATLAKRNVPNARIIHGDAKRLLQDYIGAASVMAIHVYFPDPWWKKRHQKRMVVVDPVVEHIVRLLKDEGELF